MNDLALLLDALAVARLTRLVTKDVITQGPRDAVIRWSYRWDGRERELTGLLPDCEGCNPPPSEVVRTDAAPPKVARLITCPWCASVWIAGGVVVVRRLAPHAWARAARVLAMSQVAGYIANRD